MRNWHVVFALLFALAAQEASAQRELYLQQTPGQQVVYEGGVGWVTAPGDVSVTVSIRPDSRRRAWFTMLVTNRSSSAVSVRETDVVFTVQGSTLRSFSAEELLKKERRKQGWQNLAAGLAAGLNTYGASQQGSYSATGSYQGNFSATSSRGYIRGTTDGTVLISGTDPVARQLAYERASQQNAQLIAGLRAQHAEAMGSLEARLFTSQTISPGDSYGGDVAFELPRAAKGGNTPIAVQVHVGDSPRTFFVFVDSPPTPVQLAALRELNPAAEVAATAPQDSGASIESQRVDVPTPALPAAVAMNAPEPVAVADVQTQPPAPVPAASANSDVLLNHLHDAVVQAAAPAIRGSLIAVHSGKDPLADAILNDPIKFQRTMSDALRAYVAATGLTNLLSTQIDTSMTQSEIAQAEQFLSSSAGRHFVEALVQAGAFGDTSKMRDVTPSAANELLVSAIKKNSPDATLASIYQMLQRTKMGGNP